MRQIRSRIRVAKNIQQITKAMKMVAAARLRRAQEGVTAARPYSEAMRQVMQDLARRLTPATVRHPLLRTVSGPPVNVGILIMTGDRGLCGSYNSNAIRRAVAAASEVSQANVKLVCVGKRGASFFRRRGYNVAAEFSVPQTGTNFALAQQIAAAARALFENQEIDVLHLVYTQFVSAMTQRTQNVQLLPIVSSDDVEMATPLVAGIEFEPSAEAILHELLPKYLDTLVYQALLDSVASEHGARMTSMSSATDNAAKMISGLTLSLNRARQATITKEIAEIVGGAEALK
jgi:F-type H+-transporting ATPase subunit gamma